MSREVHVQFCERLGLQCPGLLTAASVRSSQGKESTRIRFEERLGAVPGAMAGFVAMNSPRAARNVGMTTYEPSREL